MNEPRTPIPPTGQAYPLADFALGDLAEKATQLYAVADYLDTWASAHAPDPDSHARAHSSASDLFAAAAMIRQALQREGGPR